MNKVFLKKGTLHMRAADRGEANMEVFVSCPSFRFSTASFPNDSIVRDVLSRFVQEQGVSSFYVITNGRISALEDPLQHGAVYHLEPRLCGGKGGFGSMLRALGAQIEKTTNREACRDLSGRRLRDVNHEKEMAEWLKKQSEREAEKEQRRLERLQRKLAEPRHQFTDPEFQQQCHDLSERLEDSVLKGLQASSSSQVKVDDVLAAKRLNSDQSQEPVKKKKKKTAATTSACFWTGLDELPSSEEDEDCPTSSSRCGTSVTMTTPRDETVPEQSSCSSPASDHSSSSTHHTPRSPEPCTDPGKTDGGPQSPAQTLEKQTGGGDPGKTDEGHQEPCSSSQQQHQGRPPLDLSSVSSVEQLESLGLDVLKEELMSRGLKCGGTLSERAARLYSVQGLTPNQINPALLAKPGKSRRK
ncbi:hypothetical protein Q5P01_025830 [Channa striata]|uniref:Replication stress response regulator SDE2 n=1 Tax=Channa striata TaxID=64152 RepID=A0AA88J667_CHASR|nr:hypothetical protein Q5P01_025830 [Channa striata]